MEIHSERTKIIDNIKYRYSTIEEKLRSVDKDEQQAISDMEDAGTHDLRENTGLKTAHEAFNTAIMSKAALMRLRAAGTSFIDDYIPTDIVSIGTTVILENVETKEQYCKMIVPVEAASPAIGAISEESPVGKAIIGKERGAVIPVTASTSCLTYKILDLY